MSKCLYNANCSMISKLIVYCVCVLICKGIGSLTSVTVHINRALYLCSVYIDRLCHLNTSYFKVTLRVVILHQYKLLSHPEDRYGEGRLSSRRLWV